jgi:hypothetical protein
MESNNIALIYDYTQKHIESINKSIDILNTKISFFLLLYVLILISNTQFNYLDCFLLTGISISIYTLLPKATGGVTPPEILMNEYYYESEENCRLVIVKTWLETIIELELIRDRKAKQLYLVGTFLLLSIIASFL